MANKEISELTSASLPLTGAELVHVVQSGNSRQSTVDAINNITGLTAKTTPVDADELRLWDSVASAFKKLSIANLKALVLALFNVSGSAPVYGCRAWVNFNGSTGTIRASGNVSSITKNTTGDYTINFTTAMPDANYGFSGACRISGNGRNLLSISGSVAPTASALRISTLDAAGTFLDADWVGVAIFR